MNATDPKIKVDHRDHDTLNNTRGNLRLATVSQNAANRLGADRTNKCGIRGVFWHKGNRKWAASIRVNGKKIYLGYYPSADQASKAYAVANAKCFGEFGGIT